MSQAQYDLKTNNTKFLKLVANNVIEPALKTYTDTVLFYYLGCLAASNSPGDIFEIGVGGSTYPMIEIAETIGKIFFIIDCDKNRLEYYSNLELHMEDEPWPNAKLEKIVIDAKELNSSHITNQLSYCHIDGSKNFKNTMSDIEFCLNNLSTNGLICQDDYGNHKWPTVTDAVKDLEFRDKIKLILVGDSSVWFTKPEYYEYWMSLLNKDYEYSLLTELCNVSNSDRLGKTPTYFYINSLSKPYKKDNYSDSELCYFDDLIRLDTMNYLQMPYLDQSKFGISLSRYYLTGVYDRLKGPDWPKYAPVTKEEIEHLPDWIKFELETVFKIDIFSYRGNQPQLSNY